MCIYYVRESTSERTLKRIEETKIYMLKEMNGLYNLFKPLKMFH